MDPVAFEVAKGMRDDVYRELKKTHDITRFITAAGYPAIRLISDFMALGRIDITCAYFNADYMWFYYDLRNFDYTDPKFLEKSVEMLKRKIQEKSKKFDLTRSQIFLGIGE